MYKILIADDEPKFRDFLRTCIDWNKYGFEICAQARNGIEALEMASKTFPDIALLDINMPLMDGISLTEKLKEKNKNIAIVLITGHSEFEYARKALKLGVDDYVLKPFKKEELLSSVIKLKLKLQKIHEEEKQAKGDASFLRERFLGTLIGDDYNTSDEETERILNRLGLDLFSGVFIVAAIEIDNMYQLWTDAHEIALWKFAVSNILSEIFVPKGIHLVFNGPEGRVISIINFVDEEDRKNYNTEPYKKLCYFVKKYLGFTVTVGIGRQVSSYKEIRKSYLETVLALQNKLVETHQNVIEYSSLVENNTKTGFYRIELNDKILIALRVNDLDEIRSRLNQVMQYIKDNKLSVDYTYTILMGLVSICLSYIIELDEQIETVLGKEFSPYAEIKSKTTLEGSFDWLMSIFEKTSIVFKENRKSRAQVIIDNVKEYIAINYMDCELSVEKIAHNVYLDSSYIRKIFAKELNINVTDYITNTRMQKAREYLSAGNIKLSEISDMVGYSDAGYFSKCFKKYFGVSPSEYSNAKNR